MKNNICWWECGEMETFVLCCWECKIIQLLWNTVWQFKLTIDLSLLLFSCSVMPDSFATPWTVACQVSLSMGFPRQEHWSGLPSPSEVPLNTGIESPSPALAGGFFTTEPLGKPLDLQYDSEILLLGVYPFPGWKQLFKLKLIHECS